MSKGEGLLREGEGREGTMQQRASGFCYVELEMKII
jgi:hypothetical protein